MTFSPTRGPSSSPSQAPTGSPVVTGSPTKLPTSSPVILPTTGSPSSSPVVPTTGSPSSSPIVITDEPTLGWAPTAEPSKFEDRTETPTSAPFAIDLGLVDDVVYTNKNAGPRAINPLVNDNITGTPEMYMYTYSAPENGTIRIGPYDSIMYQPTPNFCGTDSFIYTLIEKARGESDSATVTVIVSCDETTVATTTSPTPQAPPTTTSATWKPENGKMLQDNCQSGSSDEVDCALCYTTERSCSRKKTKGKCLWKLTSGIGSCNENPNPEMYPGSKSQKSAQFEMDTPCEEIQSSSRCMTKKRNGMCFYNDSEEKCIKSVDAKCTMLGKSKKVCEKKEWGKMCGWDKELNLCVGSDTTEAEKAAAAIAQAASSEASSGSGSKDTQSSRDSGDDTGSIESDADSSTGSSRSKGTGSSMDGPVICDEILKDKKCKSKKNNCVWSGEMSGGVCGDPSTVFMSKRRSPLSHVVIEEPEEYSGGFVMTGTMSCLASIATYVLVQFFV